MSKSWTRFGFVLVALIALAAVGVGAQQRAAATAGTVSDAVNNQLKAIDQDRAAFVDQLLLQWAASVDPNIYDLQTELRPIAMKAPAWQLYGASLVGDFRTMVRVLGGVEGAGQYINAFSEPQPKTAGALLAPTTSLTQTTALAPTPDIALLGLGSATDSLVFNPIPPCRLVDTREPGVGSGILAAGIPRSFDLTTAAVDNGQAGATSCAGLPLFSYGAWAVNITVTGYSGNGHLTVWPFGGTEPNASVANFGSAPYALASGQTLTGCYGCGKDITVKADAPTHVIIDVVGYFPDAPVVGSTVTREAGSSTPIAAASSAWV
ncbi:MAG: hypothetical protein ACM3NQ_02330, partial [Bacteroidales bacterium]